MQQLNVPSDSTQKKVLKAFKKLGFTETLFGKGSHRMVEDPRTGAGITIQHKIRKDVLREYCKKIIELGYDADQFIKKL